MRMASPVIVVVILAVLALLLYIFISIPHLQAHGVPGPETPKEGPQIRGPENQGPQQETCSQPQNPTKYCPYATRIFLILKLVSSRYGLDSLNGVS